MVGTGRRPTQRQGAKFAPVAAHASPNRWKESTQNFLAGASGWCAREGGTRWSLAGVSGWQEPGWLPGWGGLPRLGDRPRRWARQNGLEGLLDGRLLHSRLLDGRLLHLGCRGGGGSDNWNVVAVAPCPADSGRRRASVARRHPTSAGVAAPALGTVAVPDAVAAGHSRAGTAYGAWESITGTHAGGSPVDAGEVPGEGAAPGRAGILHRRDRTGRAKNQ